MRTRWAARSSRKGAFLCPAALAAMGVAALLTAPPRSGAAYVEDPAPGHTGGFGEPTCQACHFGDSANEAAGALRLEGVPERSKRAATHRLTVALDHPGLERGGFQLGARFADGTPAGSLEPVDTRSHVTRIDESGLEYAHHAPQGTEARSPGTLRWQVRWTAPSSRSGTVVFHAAANASNDDDSPFGDVIYSTEATTVVGSSPTP